MSEDPKYLTTAAMRREVRLTAGIDQVDDLGFTEVAPEVACNSIAIVAPCDLPGLVVSGSRRARCSTCGAAVWVSPSMPAIGELVCLRCASRAGLHVPGLF